MPEVDARPIFISEIDIFGGAERSLLALARWLWHHGLPSYLLTYRDGCNIARYADFPVEVVSLAPPPGVHQKISSLRRHLKARPPGVPSLLCSGYQPTVHATLAGARGFHCIMHDTQALFGDELTRSMAGELRIAVSNRIAGYGLRSGGKTVVNSEFLRRECRKDFGVDAQIVRMGGFTYEPALRSKRLPRESNNRMNLLSVCRIEPNKRLDWILRALASLERAAVLPLRQVLSSYADWQLHLAGGGALIPELTSLAASLGIAQRVHFHGFVPDEQLEALYGEADLFVMPAVQGYGIPAVEALRRNIPVLIHRDSGVSDILLDTPWATVQHGGEDELPSLLAQAVEAILSGRHLCVERPSLPTEEEWAERVVTLCGWG